jgi:3-phenylpropionate/trans-cinnamate dioxygenase ferredoxin component
MPLFRITTTTTVPPGSAQVFQIADRRIALFNVDGSFFAIDDECTHEGGPLSEGEVAGGCVTCPWHGAEFDLRTGKVLALPAAENVRSYKVVVAGDEVSVEVE